MNAHSLYINNRLFREAGLDPVKDAPKTWDDVAKLNKVLTKRKDGPGRPEGLGDALRGGALARACSTSSLTRPAGTDPRRQAGVQQRGRVRALAVWKSVRWPPR